MKRKILTVISLTFTVGLFVIFSSCNSGSKSKTDSSVSKEQVTSDMIQGAFEYLSPLQGYAIMFDNYYLYVFGNSDSTMYCHGGKYEISGDTITNTVLFAMNPNQVGNTFQWMGEESGDTLKIAVIDKDGSISQTAKSVRKVKVTEELKNQMKDIEGMFQYLAPLQGMGTNLGGYFIYLYGQSNNTMTTNAGTYEEPDDTIISRYIYATNSQLIGEEFSWINQSVVRDTFTFAILNDAKEISFTGQSIRIR